MSLAQIRYFVAVAEEGNMGRAAEKLHVSQPPLSRQIQALEDEIGTPLFVRTPRGMRLLPSGEAFLYQAGRILNAVNEATAAARAAGVAVPLAASEPTIDEHDPRRLGHVDGDLSALRSRARPKRR